MNRRLRHLAADVALMLAFTLAWEHIGEFAEHAKTLVTVPVLGAFLYNYAHAGAHKALHAGIHRVLHLAHRSEVHHA